MLTRMTPILALVAALGLAACQEEGGGETGETEAETSGAEEGGAEEGGEESESQ